LFVTRKGVKPSGIIIKYHQLKIRRFFLHIALPSLEQVVFISPKKMDSHVASKYKSLMVYGAYIDHD